MSETRIFDLDELVGYIKSRSEPRTDAMSDGQWHIWSICGTKATVSIVEGWDCRGKHLWTKVRVGDYTIVKHNDGWSEELALLILQHCAENLGLAARTYYVASPRQNA